MEQVHLTDRVDLRVMSTEMTKDKRLNIFNEKNRWSMIH